MALKTVFTVFQDIPGDLPDPEFRESPKAMETPTTACSETDQQSEGGLREANEVPTEEVDKLPPMLPSMGRVSPVYLPVHEKTHQKSKEK